MKFDKKLQWQLIPEWRDRYCDYKLLKKMLRKLKQRCYTPSQRSWILDLRFVGWHRSGKKISIAVHSRGNALFETEVSGIASEEEKAFFRTLDLQLGIVNEFYIAREKDLESGATVLLFQLQNAVQDVRKTSCLRKQEAELCKQLSLLARYSSLNRMAFWKIMKKYDKITEQNVAPVYMRAVEASYFRTSPKLLDTMEQVKTVFKRYSSRESFSFCPSSSSPTKNFCFGLVTGSCIGLLTAFVLLHVLSRRKWGADAVQSTFPVYGTLALFVLHVSMYACNVYLWQRSRIRYASMFEMAPGADITHHDIFFISLILATILLLGIVVSLAADTLSIRDVPVDIPLYIVVIIAALLFLPYKLLYKQARYGVLRLKYRTLLSPLSTVEFADFFFADQLTSQAVALKGLGFTACYHGGRFMTGNPGMCYSTTYQHVILLLPQWWRFLQCLRKWHDGDEAQLANAGKYLCGMLSIVAKLAYTRTNVTLWFVLLIVVSLCTTVYQLFWDLVMDWGLLQRRSRNLWLRDELVLSRKDVYVSSMILNVLLRFAWVHAVLPLGSGTNQTVVEFTVACLEVARRGIWNFFRLENEHVRNQAIPL